MNNYEIIFTKAAKKQFDKLSKEIKSRIFKVLQKLAQNPKPSGSIQLNNFKIEDLPFENFHRIRVGDYRIIYAIENEIITVTVVRIKHRKEVYK